LIDGVDGEFFDMFSCWYLITIIGVQGKNNAYHNVNKVQNSFTDALISNLLTLWYALFLHHIL
jgi:hypothetical protein